MILNETTKTNANYNIRNIPKEDFLSLKICVSAESTVKGFHDDSSFLWSDPSSLHSLFGFFPEQRGNRLGIIFNIGEDVRNGISLKFT